MDKYNQFNYLAGLFQARINFSVIAGNLKLTASGIACQPAGVKFSRKMKK
jgi:hypothetical protein